MRQTELGSKRALLVQGFILAASASLALGVHWLIATADLDDRVELALCAGTLAALLLASAIVLRARRRVPAASQRRALAALACGCLAVLGTFAWTDYPDASVALADLIAPAQAADGGGALALGPTGEDVRLSGDIVEGTAERLHALLASHSRVTRIHLTSDGGLADEGQALGEVIAAHKLATYVPDYCVSACTLAFVAGHERIVMEGARLGFHRPFYEGMLGQIFAGDASVQRSAYLAAGLTRTFVDAALRVAPDDVWFPSPAQLLAAHVATRIVDRYQLPDSMLDGTATRQGATAALLRNFPALAPIETRAPNAVAAIAERYLLSYQQGHTEGADVDEVKGAVRGALAITLSRADDATLLRFARYLSRAMRAAHDQPETCVAIGSRADVLLGELNTPGDRNDADLAAADLVAAALAYSGQAPARDGEPRRRHDPPTCRNLEALYARMIARRDAAPLRAILASESRSQAVRLAAWLKASR